VASLKPVGTEDAGAYWDARCWERWPDALADWTLEDVQLYRCLMGSTDEEIADVVEELQDVFEGEDEGDTRRRIAALLEAWRSDPADLFTGSAYTHTESGVLLGARHMGTGMPAGGWTFLAAPLTDDLAVLIVGGDEPFMIGWRLWGRPAGLVRRASLLPGVTTLLSVVEGFQLDFDLATESEAYGLVDAIAPIGVSEQELFRLTAGLHPDGTMRLPDPNFSPEDLQERGLSEAYHVFLTTVECARNMNRASTL